MYGFSPRTENWSPVYSTSCLSLEKLFVLSGSPLEGQRNLWFKEEKKSTVLLPASKTVHNDPSLLAQGWLVLPIGYHQSDSVGLSRLGNKKHCSFHGTSLRQLAYSGAIQLPCCGGRWAVSGSVSSTKKHWGLLARASSNLPTMSMKHLWSESSSSNQAFTADSSFIGLPPHERP